MQGAIKFEEGKFGTRAILASPWSPSTHDEIMRLRPSELELNTSKGWFGSDIEFVSDYVWLRSIIIIDMKIDNISPVMNLVNLVSLDVVTYCKTRLNFYKFPNLRECSLEWRSGSESLFECVDLTYLFVNRYNTKSSAPFCRLVNLEYLAILNSPISELHGLAGLIRLRSLRLGGLRALKSLEGIESLCHLESFEMQICKSVKSLAALSGLNGLIEVNVSSNGELDSLSPLRGLPKLRTVLFYETTKIVDGDLRPILMNPAISKVSFQNRRHYSHKLADFNRRDQG